MVVFVKGRPHASEDDFLVQLITDWLEAAVSGLRSSLSCVERIERIESWVYNEDGSWEKLPFTHTYSSQVDRIVFQQNPHWKSVKDIVLNDASFRQFLSQPQQMAPNFSGTLPVEEWFKRLLPFPVQRSDSLQLIYLSGERPDIGSFLHQLRTGWRTPNNALANFGTARRLSYKLEDGITFRVLTNDEKMRVLRAGLIRSHVPYTH